MKFVNEEIFLVNAAFCKAMANPKRLKILAMLGIREQSVGEMAESMGIPISNVSQHLSVLKSNNIVNTRTDGRHIYYSISDKRLLVACMMIRSVLLDELKRRGLVANSISVDNLVIDD